MKLSNYYILNSIVALVIGLLLVIWPDMAVKYLVVTVGVVFFVAGLLFLINHFKADVKAEKSHNYTLPIGGLGSLLLGIFLMATPDFFVNVLMYVLGALLLLGGAEQFIFLIKARKWSNVPGFFYITPSLIMVIGLVILFYPFEVASLAFIILGISLIMYAITEFVNGCLFKRLENHVKDFIEE